MLTRNIGPSRLGPLNGLMSIPVLIGPVGVHGTGRLVDLHLQLAVDLLDQPADRLDRVLLGGVVVPKEHSMLSAPFAFIGMLLLFSLAMFLYGVSSIPSHGSMADPRVWIP